MQSLTFFSYLGTNTDPDEYSVYPGTAGILCTAGPCMGTAIQGSTLYIIAGIPCIRGGVYSALPVPGYIRGLYWEISYIIIGNTQDTLF